MAAEDVVSFRLISIVPEACKPPLFCAISVLLYLFLLFAHAIFFLAKWLAYSHLSCTTFFSHAIFYIDSHLGLNSPSSLQNSTPVQQKQI